MNTKLFPRLAGVLGIHAALIALLWAIVKFGLADQNALSEPVLALTEGDPLRIQAYLDEMIGALLTVGATALIISALLAGLWLYMIDRNPPFGDKSARGKRGPWAGMLLLALSTAGAACWLRIIGAPIAETLASSLPVITTAIVLALVLVGFWLSTAVFVPSSTKIAIPGASLFGS